MWCRRCTFSVVPTFCLISKNLNHLIHLQSSVTQRVRHLIIGCCFLHGNFFGIHDVSCASSITLIIIRNNVHLFFNLRNQKNAWNRHVSLVTKLCDKIALKQQRLFRMLEKVHVNVRKVKRMKFVIQQISFLATVCHKNRVGLKIRSFWQRLRSHLWHSSANSSSQLHRFRSTRNKRNLLKQNSKKT